MADHLVTISFVMHDMDGTPDESALIIVDDWEVLRDYWQSLDFEVTAEDVTPAGKDWDND